MASKDSTKASEYPGRCRDDIEGLNKGVVDVVMASNWCQKVLNDIEAGSDWSTECS